MLLCRTNPKSHVDCWVDGPETVGAAGVVVFDFVEIAEKIQA